MPEIKALYKNRIKHTILR